MLIKLLVAALIFLSLMFIGLVWLVAILAKITLWLPIGVTLLFVLSIASVFLVRYLAARKASKGLEDALRSQAKQQALLTRPDLQLEVQRMRDEFDKAVQALKSSRLGTAGRDALYYLPWYTIIGPPGAGKSTALRNSGLRFPYLSDSGGAVKGMGGTRNCDWWLTNQAVVLDTAGRWATQEEDHDEWLSFLAMVKKHRPKKPLNGLITAISVGDIVSARDDEVEALARRMRERVDEVIGQLNVALPVYVLFTKCDLVEGFVEMFGDLKRADRDQVWGFTAPLAQPIDDPGAFFEGRFAELAEVLEARSLGRMSEERNVPRRQRVYAFPQQFAMMRRNLGNFTRVLFERNIYKETPSMRGVYFTSGTQEGRPFSLLLNRWAEAMGVRSRVPDTGPVVDQKSYFLHDVFMNVIFEDREVASASEAELKRQRIKRLLITTALTAVAAGFSLVPGAAYRENSSQLATTSQLVDQWEKKDSDVANQSALQRFTALEAVTQNLESYQGDAPRWLTTLGMYQGDRVRGPLRRYYANLLRRVMVQPVIASDLQRMTDFGLRYESLQSARPTPDEQTEQYGLLKLHLVMSAPKGASEPPYDEAMQKWVAAQLVSRWGGYGQGVSATQLGKLRATAATYAAFVSEYKELPFSRDREVVTRVREALTRVPFARRALERIVASVAAEGYDLSLDRLIGRTGAIIGPGTIRGAFTRRGWENRVRDMLDASVLEHAGELWVLGLADRDEGSAKQLAAQLSELSSIYFQAYINEWQTFLRGVHVEAPANDQAALELLRDLTRGQPPLLSLLIQKVHANVQLKPKEEKKDVVEAAKEGALNAIKDKIGSMLGDEKAAALQKAVQAQTGGTNEDGTDRLTAVDVAKAFDGFTGFAVPPDTGDNGPRPSVPYDAYQEQLFAVRDALQMESENPDERDQLVQKLQSARVRVRALIDEQPPGFRSMFEAILWPPIEGASSSSNASLASSVSGRWCTEVVVPFERSIKGTYPFDPAGHDLSLDDLNQFFLTDTGILWTFLKGPLARTVELDGDTYVFSKKLGEDAGTLYNSRLLEFLKNSRDIADVFYPRGSTTPQVDFEVRIHPSPDVATTTMTVGGTSIEYHNGPEKWELLSWPGKSPAAGASFVIRGANGMHERINQEDVWGLFRLIEAGTVTRVSGRTFTVAWQLQTHDVTLKVDFRPTRGESPFFGVPGHSQKPVLFDPLRAPDAQVPKSIVTGGKPCKA